MGHSRSSHYDPVDGVPEISNHFAGDLGLSHGVAQTNGDYLFFRDKICFNIIPQADTVGPIRSSPDESPLEPGITLQSLDQTWATAYYQDFVYDEPGSYIGATIFPDQAGLIPIEKCPSITTTMMSTSFSDTEDVSEALSPRDDATGRRKERRRAQNRAAQRAFRARKEETIKESSARLEVLESEITKLNTTNVTLNTAVNELNAQVVQLQLENADLRGRSMYDWGDSSRTKALMGIETPDNLPSETFKDCGG